MEDQLKRLISHYRKALHIKPNNLAVYNRIAELYYEQGELEKTLEVCQEALQVQPNLVLTPQILPKMLQNLGFEGEEVANCQKLLQAELDITAFFQALWNMLSRSEYAESNSTKTWKDAVALGFTLSRKKGWDEAVLAYIKAIEIEPSLSLSHFALYHLSYCTSLQPN